MNSVNTEEMLVYCVLSKRWSVTVFKHLLC